LFFLGVREPVDAMLRAATATDNFFEMEYNQDPCRRDKEFIRHVVKEHGAQYCYTNGHTYILINPHPNYTIYVDDIYLHDKMRVNAYARASHIHYWCGPRFCESGISEFVTKGTTTYMKSYVRLDEQLDNGCSWVTAYFENGKWKPTYGEDSMGFCPTPSDDTALAKLGYVTHNVKPNGSLYAKI
jgi:hypothetical protein